jgi:hypothetical protein
MADDPGGEAYRVHVWIRQISPMIWRRLMVDSGSSIADLHHTSRLRSAGRILISIGSTSTAGITASARSAALASRPMQNESVSPTSAFASTNDSATNTTSATPGSTKCESSNVCRARLPALQRGVVDVIVVVGHSAAAAGSSVTVTR